MEASRVKCQYGQDGRVAVVRVPGEKARVIQRAAMGVDVTAATGNVVAGCCDIVNPIEEFKQRLVGVFAGCADVRRSELSDDKKFVRLRGFLTECSAVLIDYFDNMARAIGIDNAGVALYYPRIILGEDYDKIGNMHIRHDAYRSGDTQLDISVVRPSSSAKGSFRVTRSRHAGDPVSRWVVWPGEASGHPADADFVFLYRAQQQLPRRVRKRLPPHPRHRPFRQCRWRCGRRRLLWAGQGAVRMHQLLYESSPPAPLQGTGHGTRQCYSRKVSRRFPGEGQYRGLCASRHRHMLAARREQAEGSGRLVLISFDGLSFRMVFLLIERLCYSMKIPASGSKTR